MQRHTLITLLLLFVAFLVLALLLPLWANASPPLEPLLHEHPHPAPDVFPGAPPPPGAALPAGDDRSHRRGAQAWLTREMETRPIVQTDARWSRFETIRTFLPGGH